VPLRTWHESAERISPCLETGTAAIPPRRISRAMLASSRHAGWPQPDRGRLSRISWHALTELGAAATTAYRGHWPSGLYPDPAVTVLLATPHVAGVDPGIHQYTGSGGSQWRRCEETALLSTLSRLYPWSRALFVFARDWRAAHETSGAITYGCSLAQAGTLAEILAMTAAQRGLATFLDLSSPCQVSHELRALDPALTHLCTVTLSLEDAS
jgi:hypothetical protein